MPALAAWDGLGVVGLILVGLVLGAVPAMAVVVSAFAGQRGIVRCVAVLLALQALAAGYFALFNLNRVRDLVLEEYMRLCLVLVGLNGAWIITAVVLARLQRAERRAAAGERGRCAHCGYPRCGAVCPECGKPHTPEK